MGRVMRKCSGFTGYSKSILAYLVLKKKRDNLLNFGAANPEE